MVSTHRFAWIAGSIISLLWLSFACQPISPDSGLEQEDIKNDVEPYPEPEEITDYQSDSNTYPAPQEEIQNDWKPVSNDSSKSRGSAEITEARIDELESLPVQYKLYLNGNLPTPCSELRVVISDADKKQRVYIDVYSIFDPNEMCIQVLEPFNVQIPLEQYPNGTTIWVNGEKVGEINL